MPIYEYECTDCGAVIEVMQKVNTRRAPGRCEKCSGKLKKKISVASFHLKGGGWYSDGYGNAASSDSSSTSSSEKSEKSEKSKKKEKDTKPSSKPKKKAGSA